jgi:predicted Rossmann fold nucleotide-binding protein DprA/Smf involved in DNA uptake
MAGFSFVDHPPTRKITVTADHLRDDVQSLPEQGYAAGPLDLLDHNPVAVYSSRRMPLSVLESSEATIRALAEAGVVLAGGWHSRMEKRLLKAAAQVAQSRLIYFLAKGIERFRLLQMLRPLYAQQRLLILSPFRSERRITRRLVEQRDAWMRSLIKRYLFCYLDPDGTTPDLLQQCLEEDKRVFVLDHPQNAPFIEGAVQAINRYTYREVLSL